jgi:hypothetical protein
MLEASQELFSGAGSYMRRLFGMIFRPGHTGLRIADEVHQRINGETEKHHAARFFYSTLGAVLFVYLIVGLLLVWDGPETNASQFYQASYFIAAVVACEAVSLLSFSRAENRKIHAAISIHAVSLWITSVSVFIIASGVIFFWTGFLTNQPELFTGLIALIGLLAGLLFALVFFYRATRSALGWPMWRACLQALLSVLTMFIVFSAGGFLIVQLTSL